MAKLADIIDRPRQHYEEDGVMELTLGLTFFLTGAVWWFQRAVPHGSLFAAPPLPWLVIILACLWGRKMLKERVIAPRAGYVVLRDTTDVGVGPLKSRMLVRMLWLFLFFVILRIAQRQPWAWMTGLGYVAIFGICGIWSAVHYKALRYLWLAGLSLVLATWMYLTHASLEKVDDIVMMWLGGGLALMGAIRLRNFLAANSPLGGANGND